MDAVHPDPSSFGEPVAAPVVAPAPSVPSPTLTEAAQAMEQAAEEILAAVKPAAPEPVAQPAPIAGDTPRQVIARGPEAGWHELSGLSNGVTGSIVKE